MHLCEDPPPIESLVPGIDPATAALVGSMLAKKREDRPSMEQVAVTLKQQSATGSASYPSISQSAIARATATTAPMAGLSGDQSGSLSHPSMLGRMVGQQVEQKPSGSLLWTLILGACS